MKTSVLKLENGKVEIDRYKNYTAEEMEAERKLEKKIERKYMMKNIATVFMYGVIIVELAVIIMMIR